MKISNLKLTNFRNHSNFEIDFENNSMLIIGQNGVGKTNILESIYFLSSGKSIIAKYDKELINHNKQFAKVNAKVSTDDKDLELEISIIKRDKVSNYTLKKVKINKVVKSVQFLTGALTSVLFVPSDIEIFTNSPSERRKYVDTVISQSSIKYKKALNEFSKASKQLNKVYEQINEAGYGFDQLEFWESKVIETAKVIQECREDFFNFVNSKINMHSKELNENSDTNLEIKYLKKELNSKKLEEYRQKCIWAKTLLIGPHRDDFETFLNNFQINSYGSRGQQRTALLAIKLCEIDFLTQKRSERPILLLDDIFSELDEDHKNKIIEIIDKQQTIITSAESIENLSYISQKMPYFTLKY